jgi:hypothetical protein
MSRRRQHRAWELITASVLLVTLLLVLLPHPHHLTLALAACPVLAIVFLFGTVHLPWSLWLLSRVSEEHPPQSPVLPSRFQRPPPTCI